MPAFLKHSKSLMIAALTMVALVAASTATVLAQANQATLTFGTPENEEIVIGEAFSIPFYLNTNGISVDGVQVTARFAGVPVNEVRLEMAGEMRAQALSQEVTNEGFDLLLSSADPSLPLVTNEDTLLFELTVVPSAAGQFRVEYDRENTLVPSSADSTNILATPENVMIPVGVEPGVPAPGASSSLFNAVLALAAVAVLVVLGVLYMQRQSQQPSRPSDNPTTEV